MSPSIPHAPGRRSLVARLRNWVPLLALAGFAAGAAALAQGHVDGGSSQQEDLLPIGINLRPITPYDRSWVFADAMRMASPWRFDGQDFGPRLGHVGKDGEKSADIDVVPVDAHGWPRPTRNRAVSCQFLTGMRGRIPVGEYVVTWKGAGSVEFRGSTDIVSQEPGRLVVDVDTIRGDQPGIVVRGFDPADPIRDVRVWFPGLEDSCSSFHPEFLDKLKPFSVLRFYPWMRVYTSTGRWADRTLITDARQGSDQGVAIELMVELCNELRADPWFCIPHLADDDYVRRFAQLVRDGLNRRARIYVEYSNEVWNTDYLAGQWFRAEAQRRGIPAMRIQAEYAARVFRIWHEVFGNEKHRVVRVAGAQLNNLGVASSLCQALDGEFDALAVGAYFGARADRDDVDDHSTAMELMTVARNNLDTTVLQRIADHRALADEYSAALGRHIALLSYEGGQSIVARSPGGGLGLEATLECQRMPEMFAAYRALIEGGKERGLELLVAYDFAGSRNSADTFSILEYIQEPPESAVKYRALVQGWELRRR